MTRKRYVKLLMGHGYSRNTANLCAYVLVLGKTYQQDYDARERRARRFYEPTCWIAIKTRYLGRWKKEPEA